MKFNTITYDANLPTVQQVNVPTNSDYKVGMKVKRNGEVQSIKPSEFTIYTGEINVVPPTDYIGEAKSITATATALVVLYQPEATAEMNSKVVKAKDIRFEASYDDGATWQEVAPLEYAGIVQIIDRSAGTNNYVAQMDPRVPTKWYLLSGGQVVGEAAEITMPTTFRFLLNSNSSGWTFTSFPCKFRIVIPYGGYEERVTYPVDQEKTNGYVTITKASGDEATFKQYEVNVETEAPTKFEDTRTASSKDGNVLCRVLEAQLSAYGGQRIYAKDIHLFQSNDNVNWREVLDSTNNINYIRLTVDKTSTFAMKYLTTAYPDYQYGKWAYWPDPQDVENIEWLDYVEIPTSNPRIMTSIHPATLTIPDASKFTYPCYFKMTVQIGADQIVANFKLNINEFKSQSGDIAETLADGTSVKVDGTYADGTTFSFDFCTK